MFSPVLTTLVSNNDPKGELGGTNYLVYYQLNRLGTGEHCYTIIDEINVTPPYRRYQELYQFFQEEKAEFESYQKSLSERQANNAKEERLKDNALSEDLKQRIQTNLSNFQELISQYKSGKEKALNSIVGRLLKKLKDENIDVDPLVLKETILTLIS